MSEICKLRISSVWNLNAKNSQIFTLIHPNHFGAALHIVEFHWVSSSQDLKIIVIGVDWHK